jgi:hypothetical protein
MPEPAGDWIKQHTRCQSLISIGYSSRERLIIQMFDATGRLTNRSI